MEIGPEVVHPPDKPGTFLINYYAKNAAMEDIRRWIVWPINNHLRKLRLADAGIHESDVADLFYWVNVDGLGLVSSDKGTGGIRDARRASEAEAIFVPIIMVMLMFLLIMSNVPSMLQTVMEEKTQRIAEVLLGSVKPFEFMMGKVLSGIAVSLTSSAVYIIGGILVVRHMGYGSLIPFHVLPWFFAYMLLGIVMFGSLASALGAACNEPKDAPSLTVPCIIPMVFPMFIYFPVLKEPLSRFSTVTSLIPPFTPVLMLVRQATPEHVPVWQPVVGLLGMIGFTVLFVWMGGRIFRVALLMQGTPPRLANILRWAIRG
jgi:ABC-2 type transport system permease protein